MTVLCVSPHCAMPGTHDQAAADHPDDCRGCAPAPAADGLYLCGHCVRTMERDLWKAAQLHAALGQALTGGGRGERGPGGTSTGVQLDPIAVEVRGAIRAGLAGLCRLVAEERGITLPADDVTAMARWLTGHVLWLAAHPAAGEHAGDLRDLAGDGRSWRVAYPASGDRTLIGVCNQPRGTNSPRSAVGGHSGADSGGAETCGERLYVRDGEQTITCRGCGTVGSVQWWRWELCSAADAGEVVDAYAAAAYLSWRWGRAVDAGLVRKWGQRAPAESGLLVDGDGRPVRDEMQRVLFVLGRLEQRAERMWGPASDALATAS